LDQLDKVVTTQRNDPINFFYVPSTHLDITGSFDTTYDFPKLLIVKPKRMKYVEYEGPFNSEKMKGFVEMVVSGTGDFKPLKKDITISNKPYSNDLWSEKKEK